jgi:hypothetical protein
LTFKVDRGFRLDQNPGGGQRVETYRATSKTIVCTLSKDELTDTRAAWLKLFRTALLVREEIPGGLRLVVNGGSAEALRQLIEIERDCCRWITFELDGPTVTMTAKGAGILALRTMWAIGPQLGGNRAASGGGS